jgi:hypothetical protein
VQEAHVLELGLHELLVKTLVADLDHVVMVAICAGRPPTQMRQPDRFDGINSAPA